MSTTGRIAQPPELPGLLYIAPLGSGGYSDVYLYEQQMPRMKVAVKVLAAHSLSQHAQARFSPCLTGFVDAQGNDCKKPPMLDLK